MRLSRLLAASSRTTSATGGTSRTTVRRNRSGEAGERTLDVLYDRQCDGQCLTTVFSRDGNRSVAGDGLHERLELEAERLTFRRIDGDALDERLQCLRALRVTHQR